MGIFRLHLLLIRSSRTFSFGNLNKTKKKQKKAESGMFQVEVKNYLECFSFSLVSTLLPSQARVEKKHGWAAAAGSSAAGAADLLPPPSAAPAAPLREPPLWVWKRRDGAHGVHYRSPVQLLPSRLYPTALASLTKLFTSQPEGQALPVSRPQRGPEARSRIPPPHRVSVTAWGHPRVSRSQTRGAGRGTPPRC